MSDSNTNRIDFAALATVLAKDFQEAAIVLPGPPVEIFAQRAAPTVVLKPLQQATGKYYYECQTHTGGYMQLGWADASFKSNASEGKGAGDDAHSWAYDGYRCLKWHDNQKETYGQKWKAGDVIGIAVDLEACKVAFMLNGSDIGLAFEGIEIAKYVYPCISLIRGERVTLNLGVEDNPFAYDPPAGYAPLRVTQQEEDDGKVLDSGKYSGHTNVIKMGISEGSFVTSFAGEMMVTQMGRGLDYEKKKNAMLGAGYDETLRLLETKESDFDEKLAKSDDIGLTPNELHALICYTLEKPPVYRYFNSDSRKGFGGDGMDFPILMHLLSEGCRKILASLPKEERTKELYRGTSIPFTVQPGELVRFGSYTSTTHSAEIAEKFRRNASGTQFVITAKLGAPITFLSAFPEEEEVLIPPYETFEVVTVEGTERIFVKSVVPDDLVEEYVANNGSVVNRIAALATKLKNIKVN